MIHYLKTYNVYMERIRSGEKTFEVRKNDRDFQVGDRLVLMSIDPETKDFDGGRNISADITYILPGGQFGIEPGYCVMGIEVNDAN